MPLWVIGRSSVFFGRGCRRACWHSAACPASFLGRSSFFGGGGVGGGAGTRRHGRGRCLVFFVLSSFCRCLGFCCSFRPGQAAECASTPAATPYVVLSDVRRSFRAGQAAECASTPAATPFFGLSVVRRFFRAGQAAECASRPAATPFFGLSVVRRFLIGGQAAERASGPPAAHQGGALKRAHMPAI